MPYITIAAGKKLPAEAKRQIVAELGKIITVIPGKHAGNLMTCFQDGADMAFSDGKTDNCLYMDIKLHGAAAHEAKDMLVRKCFVMLLAATGIPSDNTYITVGEFTNWGALGQYL